MAAPDMLLVSSIERARRGAPSGYQGRRSPSTTAAAVSTAIEWYCTIGVTIASRGPSSHAALE